MRKDEGKGSEGGRGESHVDEYRDFAVYLGSFDTYMYPAYLATEIYISRSTITTYTTFKSLYRHSARLSNAIARRVYIHVLRDTETWSGGGEGDRMTRRDVHFRVKRGSVVAGVSITFNSGEGCERPIT